MWHSAKGGNSVYLWFSKMEPQSYVGSSLTRLRTAVEMRLPQILRTATNYTPTFLKLLQRDRGDALHIGQLCCHIPI